MNAEVLRSSWLGPTRAHQGSLRRAALFILFAPAEDPKLAVAVFVENGKHGGSTAAPMARKMFDAYLLPDKTEADKMSKLGRVL